MISVQILYFSIKEPLHSPSPKLMTQNLRLTRLSTQLAGSSVLWAIPAVPHGLRFWQNSLQGWCWLLVTAVSNVWCSGQLIRTRPASRLLGFFLESIMFPVLAEGIWFFFAIFRLLFDQSEGVSDYIRFHSVVFKYFEPDWFGSVDPQVYFFVK